MFMTAQHLEAEDRFRALLREAGLPQPDAVDYEPGSVLFLWQEPKVAVYVDLDDPLAGAPDAFGDVLPAGGWTEAA